MGRPARAPQGAATCKITVRLPDPIAAQWRAAAAAANLTVSDWLRLQAATSRPLDASGVVGRRTPRRREGMGVAVPPPVDPAVVVQLVRIGNNLNQLARSLNATGTPRAGSLTVLVAIARDINTVLGTGLPDRAR